MTVQILQTITNTLTEQREVISSKTVEAFVITPAEGMRLQNVKTHIIYDGSVTLSSKDKVSDFIEIPKK